MRWQAIFFDFDGVITDSVSIKTEAFAEMFRQFGPDIESKVIDHHLANCGVTRFVKFRHYYENFLNQQIDEEKIQELARQFSDLVLKKVLKAPFIEGALETLESLKSENIPAYIVTATPENEMKYILQKRHLMEYFTGVYGAPQKKDSIVCNVLCQGGYTPQECLYIGDAMSDYDAAQRNGVNFLGIVPKGGKSIFPEGTRISYKIHTNDIKGDI